MSQIKYANIASNQDLSQTATCGFTDENCKRLTQDRRKISFKSIWHSFFTGRRKVIQREACDVSGHIIDTHESWLLLLVLGTVLLCITDACLTLVLLQHGAFEANPLMAILLESNINLFFWVKFTATSVPLLGLLILKNFTLFKYFTGSHLILLTFTAYVCLIRYELYLLERI